MHLVKRWPIFIVSPLRAQVPSESGEAHRSKLARLARSAIPANIAPSFASRARTRAADVWQGLYGKGGGKGGRARGKQSGDWRDKLNEKEEVEYTTEPVDCCVVASETEPMGMGIPGLKINYTLKEAMHDIMSPNNPYKRLHKWYGQAPGGGYWAHIEKKDSPAYTTLAELHSWPTYKNTGI
jgi:hypothetical protein